MSRRPRRTAFAACLAAGLIAGWCLWPASTPRRRPDDVVRSQAEADRLARLYFDQVVGLCGSFGEPVEDDHCWSYEAHAGMGGLPIGFIRVMKQTGEVSLPGKPMLTMEELGATAARNRRR